MPLRNKAGRAAGEININGNIEQFIVDTGSVSKGDFVESNFNLNNADLNNGTVINNVEKGYDSLSAAAIDNNRVFLAYADNSSKGSLVVKLLSDGNIYSTLTYALIGVKSTVVLPLSSTIVLVVSIVSPDNKKSSAHLNIFNISEDGKNTISKTSVQATIADVSSIYGVVLSSSRIFLAYFTARGDTATMTAIPYDISDTAISAVGSGISITCSPASGVGIVPIDNNTVVLSYATSRENSIIKSAVLEISGTDTNAIAGEPTDISYVLSNIKSTKLNNNSIVIAGISDTSLILKVFHPNINSGTPTYSDALVLRGYYSPTSKDIALIALTQSNVLVLTPSNNSSTISYILLYILDDITLSHCIDYTNNNNTYKLGITKLSNSNLFIYHSLKSANKNVPGYTIVNCSIKVNKYNDYNKAVYGIAKSSGTTGNLIDVYVPN